MEQDVRVVMEIKENTVIDQKGAQKFLKRLLQYRKIVVQCHDNPDADALASGFALTEFFRSEGKDVTFIYSGRNRITKSNLRIMVDQLQIPVRYVTDEIPECELLVTVDCQYGEGNVTRFEAPVIAMIDHHQCGLMQNDLTLIKSNLGSCATIVWDLMRGYGFDFTEKRNLSTALYYGLYSDTNQFDEIFHPLDRDMKDSLKKDDVLLFQLMNTNLSLKELFIASEALNKQRFVEENHYSVIPSKACDPNILGIISDFVIQVEEVDICVAYNPNPGGFKLSIRSCVKETKANELAEYLCQGIGNGGGHLTKAGGFIAKAPFEEMYGERDAMEVISERLAKYFRDYEIIYASEYTMDRKGLKKYQKKPVLVGVAVASEFLKPGMPVLVRTLEGDVDLKVEDDLYFMVGIEGEVYPIRKEKFERSYRYQDGIPEMEMEYAPTVRNNMDGEVYQLTDHMHSCVSTGTVKIYGKELEKNVKVFTQWDESKYYRGNKGDFLVVREDDEHDIYVVRRDIFFKTYEEIGNGG